MTPFKHRDLCVVRGTLDDEAMDARRPLACGRRPRMRIGDNSIYKWELGSGDEACEIDVPGPMSANETETSVRAAIDGVGLAYCLERRVSEELKAGQREVVLAEWAAVGPPFFVYYPSRRQTQPALRQLIDTIRAANLS